MYGDNTNYYRQELFTRYWYTLFGITTGIGGCPVPMIVNGAVLHKTGDYMPGDVALLTCNTGYMLHPRNIVLVCHFDGTWASSPASVGLRLCQRELSLIVDYVATEKNFLQCKNSRQQQRPIALVGRCQIQFLFLLYNHNNFLITLP